MRTKYLAMAVAGVVGSSAFGYANAGPMAIQSGDVTMYIDSLLDQGTIGYFDSSQANGTTATLCTTVAGCDAIPGQYNNVVGGPNTGGTYDKSMGSDSWGVFNINKIVSNVTGDTLWQQNVNYAAGTMGSSLTGMFYGLQDYRVDLTLSPVGAPTITSFSTGGQVDLYWNANQFNSATTTTLNRTGVSTFTGVTGGVAAASLAFNPVADSQDSGSYWRSLFNYTSQGSNSQGFLDVIVGSGAASASDALASTEDLASLLVRSSDWGPLGNTNLQDSNGIYHDVFMSITLTPPTTVQASHGWDVLGSGQAYSNVPEPGSMALAGLGLLALAGVRRRRTI